MVADLKPSGAAWAVDRAGRDDIATVRALNALFAEAFEDPGTYAAQPADDEWLRECLADEGMILLVARDAGQLLGGLVAYELNKIERRRREIYIYDLAVAAAHRRRGVATALIDRLCAIARERDCWVIYVQADYADPPAIALYEKLGVREDVLHFDIAPEDRG